jgi:CheY-like chemotaxis protein
MRHAARGVRSRGLNVKNILVVDDDEFIRMGLAEAFRTPAREFSVITAAHGVEALQVLEASAMDLVITDLTMPMMDGYQLLARLTRQYPELPVMVMSSTPLQQAAPHAGVPLRGAFLPKPLDFAEVVSRAREQLRALASGLLRGVSLSSLLQMLAQERKTCVLEVDAGVGPGTLQLVQGELVHARHQGVEGDGAAIRMLTWEGARIQLRQGFHDGPRTARSRLDFLIMEAARLQDEAERGAGSAFGEEGLLALELTEAPFGAQPPARPLPVTPPRVLAECMGIPGALCVALVDARDGAVLSRQGDGLDIELAASGIAQLMRARQQVLGELGVRGPIEDVLVTVGDQYHLLRPLLSGEDVFLYFVLHRQEANLGLARYKLARLERSLRA